nr:serine protease [Halorhodospira halochloris]
MTLTPRENSAIELERERIEAVAEDAGVLRIELIDGGTLDVLSPDAFEFLLIEDGEQSVLDAEGFRDELMGTPGTMSLASVQGSGQAGSEVEIAGAIAHEGAESAQVSVSQGPWREQTQEIDLAPWRTEESFAASIEIPWYWDPGELEVELLLTDGDGQEHTERGHYALFEDERDRELDWQFSDPFEAPLAGIGRVLAEHEDSGQVGTGFLISPEHVLTSAHVLSAEQWEADFDSLDSVRFGVGEQGRLEGGRGEQMVQASEIHWPTDHWGGGDWPSGDLALIELDKPLEAPTFEPFWNAADEPERDLTGEPVGWAGYPAEGIDQGDEAAYRWEAAGEVTGYRSEDGALVLSDSMLGAGGASGSPVFYEDEGAYYAAGVYAGASNGSPVAANLDDEAFNWVLDIVQAGGYLADLDEAQPIA